MKNIYFTLVFTVGLLFAKADYAQTVGVSELQNAWDLGKILIKSTPNNNFSMGLVDALLPTLITGKPDAAINGVCAVMKKKYNVKVLNPDFVKFVTSNVYTLMPDIKKKDYTSVALGLGIFVATTGDFMDRGAIALKEDAKPIAKTQKTKTANPAADTMQIKTALAEETNIVYEDGYLGTNQQNENAKSLAALRMASENQSTEEDLIAKSEAKRKAECESTKNGFITFYNDAIQSIYDFYIDDKLIVRLFKNSFSEPIKIAEGNDHKIYAKQVDGYSFYASEKTSKLTVIRCNDYTFRVSAE